MFGSQLSKSSNFPQFLYKQGALPGTLGAIELLLKELPHKQKKLKIYEFQSLRSKMFCENIEWRIEKGFMAERTFV